MFLLEKNHEMLMQQIGELVQKQKGIVVAQIETVLAEVPRFVREPIDVNEEASSAHSTPGAPDISAGSAEKKSDRDVDAPKINNLFALATNDKQSNK